MSLCLDDTKTSFPARFPRERESERERERERNSRGKQKREREREREREKTKATERERERERGRERARTISQLLHADLQASLVCTRRIPPRLVLVSFFKKHEKIDNSGTSRSKVCGAGLQPKQSSLTDLRSVSLD